MTKDAQKCVSPPNDPMAEGIRLEREPKALAKSSPPQGRGRHLLEKVTIRDDLSGLLVAVLDNQPTDKRTHQSEFST